MLLLMLVLLSGLGGLEGGECCVVGCPELLLLLVLLLLLMLMLMLCGGRWWWCRRSVRLDCGIDVSLRELGCGICKGGLLVRKVVVRKQLGVVDGRRRRTVLAVGLVRLLVLRLLVLLVLLVLLLLVRVVASDALYAALPRWSISPALRWIGVEKWYTPRILHVGRGY